MKQYSSDRVKINHGFWLTLEKLGVTRQTIARHTQLPVAILQNQVKPTTEQFFAIWESLPLLSGNPAIGFEFAKLVHNSQLPPELFAASLASNYRQALNRVARFKRLCAPELIKVSENSGKCEIEVEWLNTAKPTPAALVDTTFSFLIGLGSASYDEKCFVESAFLSREKSEQAYLSSLYGDNIHFGHDKNILVLDSPVLDRKLDTYNEALSSLILPSLENELSENESTDYYSNQVRWVIEQHLSAGSPPITLVAGELGVSVRTLQRRITEEGHTYKELLAEVRLAMAKKYLSDIAISLNEVAILLGYEDQNSFYRAFKLMQGETPSNWRKCNGL